MNLFLNTSFDERLRLWYDLRNSLKDNSLQSKCVEIDKFWQNAPLVNYYLHPHDMKKWPNPWDLLNDNMFCYYARALGIIYTFLLMGVKDIDLLTAKDYNNIDVVLVIVDKTYVLNYWPDSVLISNLADFTEIKYISIDALQEKLG